MNNHKKKKKLARKMMTKEDIRKKIPIFQTNNWEFRKESIRKKVANKIIKILKKRKKYDTSISN